MEKEIGRNELGIGSISMDGVQAMKVKPWILEIWNWNLEGFCSEDEMELRYFLPFFLFVDWFLVGMVRIKMRLRMNSLSREEILWWS